MKNPFRSPLDWMTLAVTVSALIVTGMLVHQRFFETARRADSGIRTIHDWETLTKVGHHLGPPRAPVKIVEFADFECPYCREAYETLSWLRTQYPERVAVVYRHFPLSSIHGRAFGAALAAECAAAQKRFEEYHDVLYRWQDSIRYWGWARYADSAGVTDVKAFEDCVSQRRYVAAVEKDVAAGQALQIRGTPTLIVSGHVYPGALSREQLDSLVTYALGSVNK